MHESSPATPRHVGGVPRGLAIAIAQVITLAIAGSLVHVPLHSLAPGVTKDVLGAISVEGVKTYDPSGEMLLTTASVSRTTLTAWEAVGVWLHPNASTAHRADVIPFGSSEQEASEDNRADIERSKTVAQVAAFRALGFDVPELPGIEVVTTLEGFPGAELLRSGDRIVAVGTRRIRDGEAFARVMSSVPAGDTVRMTIHRRGSSIVRSVRTVEADGRAFIGISFQTPYRLPTRVTIESDDIIGPSAGLVFALSIAEVLTPRDLTGGRTIGVTGTIDLDEDGRGVVGRVGAVHEKVRGAHRDGATIFIAPRPEAPIAREVAPAGMRVIGVDTLADAIRALRRLASGTTERGEGS